MVRQFVITYHPGIIITKPKPVDGEWTAEALKEHFRLFDSNKDGKLSFAELQEALKKLGVSNTIINHIRTAKAMDYADGNGDDFINLNGREFSDLIKHMSKIGFKVEKADRT